MHILNFRIFKFYWFFRKNHFAQALASLSPSMKSVPNLQHYALYRLGMYRSVGVFEPVRDSWRSLFAIIVSGAACGEKEKIAALLQDPNVMRLLKPKINSLANALLAFYPDLAVNLLAGQKSSILHVAACLRVGDIPGAKANLDACEINAKSGSEFFLYRSNLLRLYPDEQLIALNNFLRINDVSPVALREVHSPPSAMNICSTGLLPPVKGPLVSIVMTASRSADRIFFAIDSLLNQTYRNIEIVVVDDASDDDTRQVVEKLAKIDNRLHYVCLPRNVGTYVAKTIGTHLARGEFVTCQDSDDWAHPQKIAYQMEPMLLNKKVIFTTSNLVRLQDDGVFYARSVFPLARLNQSSVLFRKNVVFTQTGFWDLVRTGADSEFLARLKLVFGLRAMRRISKPLSFCAHRENSLMTSPSTGYGLSGGTQIRLDYWEHFSKWHIDSLRQGDLPKIRKNRNLQRPFPAPQKIEVPAVDVEACMKAFGLKEL